MKYAVEIVSGAMMDIPGFIVIDSDTQNLIGRHTDSKVIS
jgi:hypothetical protein